jgi:CRP-like cAMP-binding protein
MQQPILEKINAFFSDTKVREYAKGQVITFTRKEPEGVSLLLEGIVEQYDITPEGNRITVNIFKPTAFFPMSWAINKTPNTYFYEALTNVYEALTNVKLQLADADETVAFLQANPDVMFDLLSRVYKGTDALLQRLVVTASGIASSRLVFELLIEAYRFGEEIESSKWLIKTKQFSLAERSGLARETVSRELHKLANDNLIILSKRGIVLDVKKLEQKLDINI